MRNLTPDEREGINAFFWSRFPEPEGAEKALRRSRSEARFYRRILEQIADRKRSTIERRLASSALAFWDEMRKEKKKCPKKGV